MCIQAFRIIADAWQSAPVRFAHASVWELAGL